jgi:hypothetical protein
MVSPGGPKRPTLSWRAWTVLALGLAVQVAVTLIVVIVVNPGRPAPQQQTQNIHLLPVYVVTPQVEATQTVRP